MFFINKVPGKIHCLIILLLAGTNSVFGNRTDSLLALLEKMRSDTSRISILLSQQNKLDIPRVDENAMAFDVASIAPGIYTVQLLTNETTKQKRIVIQ